MRKHFLQMTSEELTFLNGFLKKENKEYKIGIHAIKRVREKRIAKGAIYRAIHNGNIIEYHFKNCNRILIRGNVDEHGFNVCVVLDCDTGNVITVYHNETTDGHSTLKQGLYGDKLDIIGMFRNTYKRAI